MRAYRDILRKLALPKDIQPCSEAAQSFILDTLLQHVEVEIAPEELSSEVARLQAYYNHQLQFELLQNGDFSVFLPQNQEKRQQQIRQEAERELKTEVLLRFIAENEHITATPEDRESEAQRIAAENNIPLENVRDFMGQSFEMLQEDLLIQKTLQWLCSYVQP